MQDIADSLNISKNSVSQALRNKNGVSEATKKAVIETAERLGYHYEKTKLNHENLTFALLATDFALSQTSFFGEIIKSIQFNCSQKNIQVEIINITKEITIFENKKETLKKYDGIILLSHSTHDFIKGIIDTGIPVIMVDHHELDLYTDAIITKNTDGVFIAIQHLLKNNYTKIGFIGDIHFSPSYLERYRGFKRSLEYFKLPFNEKQSIIQIKEEQGALFEKLDEIQDMPEAWFCVNSGLAFMLNSYLQAKGYTIPQDIAIICFDDTEFTRTAIPRITNISTDLQYMGALTVETLQKRIQQPGLPFVHQQILPTMNIYESVQMLEKTN